MSPRADRSDQICFFPQPERAARCVSLCETPQGDMNFALSLTKASLQPLTYSPLRQNRAFTRTGISTIVDMKSLEIEVDVNESYINRVKSGQAVTAVLDAYPDWQTPAHVITLVPTADRQKATVLVRIGFKTLDPRILPDMGVKVTFLREAGDTGTPAAAPVTLVPKAAIRAEGDARYVFIVRGDAVERRAVKVGGTDGDRIEVLAGLNSGDRVVISPPAQLSDGSKITVKGT